MTLLRRWRPLLLVAAVLATLVGFAGPAGAASSDPTTTDPSTTDPSTPDPSTTEGGAAAPGAPGGPEQIIGGTEAAPGTWRSQAAVLAASVRDNAQAQICGATVIDATWVLTAAHCVTSYDGGAVPAREIDVLVGTHDLRSGGRRIPVSRVVVRGDFDPFNLRNDYALLQLSRPSLVPIDLEVAGRTDVPWSGAPLRTAGWGMDENFGHPQRLREVTVPALDPGECKVALDEAEEIAGTPPYHSSHLCTGPLGSGGQGPCYGDSGGPLVWETGGRHVLVGIVSWGAYCGSPETPSVFAKVASASAWIQRTIEFGPHPDGSNFAINTMIDYYSLPLDGPFEEPEAPDSAGEFIAAQHASPLVARRDATIARLYQAVLGRSVEHWGYMYWREQMFFGGTSVTRVAEVMTRSAEFKATYGSLDDEAFVEQVFANVLGRSGGVADIGYWVDRLAAGESRGKVVALIAESSENRARTQAEVDVQIAFLNLLGRVPADWELAEWAGRPLAELGDFIVHSQAYARIWAGVWWEFGD